MLHIINNFPKEYEVIIDQGTKELSNEALTLQSLQEDLQEKYDRMKTKKGGSREIQTNDDKVLFMWQNESQKGRLLGVGSQQRQKTKNWKKNYKSSEKNKKRTKQIKNPNIVCWKCNKKGQI